MWREKPRSDFIVHVCTVCVCVFDFMTNEEQELAERVAYPLVYYTALSQCPCFVGVWVGGWVGMRVNLCDKPHIADGFDVCVQGWTLSWMQCEGNICACVNVCYELNTGWLLGPTSVAPHCKPFCSVAFRCITSRCIKCIVLRQLLELFFLNFVQYRWSDQRRLALCLMIK